MFRFVGMHNNKYGILDTDDGVIDYITKEELIKYTNMGIQIHDLHKLRDNNKRQESNKRQEINKRQDYTKRQDYDKRQEYNKKSKESNSLDKFRRMCIMYDKQPTRLNELGSKIYRLGKCKKSFFVDINGVHHIYLNDCIFVHRKSRDSYKTNILSQLFEGNVKLYGCDSLTDFKDAFIFCDSLKSIDFSDVDLSNVTDMAYMFQECNSLESVDFSGMNLSNVTNMNFMFRECKLLKLVNFSGANLSNVETMGHMFERCKLLKSANFSGASLSKVSNMWSMFEGCSILESVDFNGVNLDNVEKAYMFYGVNLEKCKILGPRQLILEFSRKIIL